MGAFIAGPVIKFSIDSASLKTELDQVYSRLSTQLVEQNKKNAASITSAIADPLAVQAAKLRALYSTGAIALKDLQVQQKALISSLDVEISKLVQRNDLDKQGLATLKQLTLERERQQNAVSRGVGVGVTSGTQSALSLVSKPIVANISRLGAGLLGVAGGSGAELSGFSAAASGIAAITAAGGPATAVLGSIAVALLAAGGAAAALAISGGKVVENFSLISQKTGISIANLQVLEAVGKTVNVGLDDVVIGFRKLSAAIAGGNDTDENGVVGATKKSSELLKILGITSKDTFTVIQQLTDVFSRLPDGAIKGQLAVQLLGKSGLNLITAFNAAGGNIEKFKDIVSEFGGTISKDAVEAQAKFKLSTVELDLAFQKLQISATPLLGILAKITEQAAKFTASVSDGSGIKSFIQALAPFVPLGEVVANTAIDFGVLDGAAKKAGTSLSQGFSAGEDALKKLSPLTKAITDELNGANEARKKLIEEGIKELQKLNDEEGKSALAKITEIGKQSDVLGLSASDKVLAEELQKLQEIAELLLKFPQFANQGAAAVASLTKATIGELQKQADEALKKRDEEDDRDQNERIKNQNEVAKILKDSEDQLAIARASATKNAVAVIIEQEQKRLDDEVAKAKQIGANEQQLAQLRIDAEQTAQARIAQLRADEIKKTQDELKSVGGQLFDALISGSKNFGQQLKQTLLNLVLSPVKTLFEAVFAGLFTGIVQRGKDALKTLGDTLQKQGGVLGEIGKILSPPGSETVKNSKALGINTDSTNKNTDAINALTSALGGQTPVGATGGGAPTLAGLGTVLFGGAGAPGSVIFNGFPGGGPNAPSGLGGGLAGFLAPALLGSALLATGGGKAAAGLGTLGGVLARIGGGSISGLLKNPGSQSSLGLLGLAVEGGGIALAGHNTGGVVGALEGAAGGALSGASIGTLIAPGIGTLVGAAIGGIAGLLGGIFGGGKTKQQKIADAINRQAIDPNLFVGKEFDRAVGATFGQTLNTTFSEGPGGTFSTAAINGPSQAPIAVHFNVNAVDAKSVTNLFQQHGTTLAKIVGGQMNFAGSGLGRRVRTAVNPA